MRDVYRPTVSVKHCLQISGGRHVNHHLDPDPGLARRRDRRTRARARGTERIQRDGATAVADRQAPGAAAAVLPLPARRAHPGAGGFPFQPARRNPQLDRRPAAAIRTARSPGSRCRCSTTPAPTTPAAPSKASCWPATPPAVIARGWSRCSPTRATSSAPPGSRARDHASVLVLNREGRVLARAEGQYDPDKAQALRETLSGQGD